MKKKKLRSDWINIKVSGNDECAKCSTARDKKVNLQRNTQKIGAG